MSSLGSTRARLLLAATLAVLILALTPAGRLLTRTAPARAATATASLPTAGDQLEPDLNIPTSSTVVFGASPGEAAGEAWAYGQLGAVPATVDEQQIADQTVLLERTASDTWQIVPLPTGPSGQPLTGSTYGALGAQATPAGGVVLLDGQNVVVRDRGAQPYLSAAPSAELASGESLVNPDPGSQITIPYAAIDDTGGHTGVLIAPYDDGAGQLDGVAATPSVLH